MKTTLHGGGGVLMLMVDKWTFFLCFNKITVRLQANLMGCGSYASRKFGEAETDCDSSIKYFVYG